VAVVHDYLTQRGGAERVALAMMRTFPNAPLYTAVYNPQATFPEFRDYDVRTIWTNRLNALQRDHRRGLAVYPLAFSSLQVDADVVLCSSSGFAHGVRTRGRKVVYCHTPPRWLYEEAPEYLSAWPTHVAGLARMIGPALRAWDKRSAKSADCYLANSRVARDRVAKTYDIEATIVAPPVERIDCAPQAPLAGLEPGFVLCVARLLGYKNVEAVCSAANLLPGVRLVVVGDGPHRKHLEKLNFGNVSFLGRVDDSHLAWLYANCMGLVSAAYEDFGITVLEAAAHGKPVAVLRSGGFLETVEEHQTGIFFDSVLPESIAKALDELRRRRWDAGVLQEHAACFGQARFSDRLRAAIDRG
jgi:glycosyltransferase involved in cell wall biosynthesis